MTKRHLYWVIPTLIAAMAAGAIQAGWIQMPDSNSEASEGPLQAAIQPLPVNVATISHLDSFRQSRSYTGTVRAKHRSDLAFEIPGQLTSVLVDEGDAVAKGDVLAKLDTQSLDARKNASTASLNQAKALLAELQAGPRSEQIEAAKANSLAAKSELQIAELNLNRRAKLRESNAVSDEDYDRALFGVRTATSNYESALQTYRELAAGTREEKVMAQEAVVAQLQAALNEVVVSIEKSKLTAPFAGTVTMRYLDPGSIVQASMPVIKLVDQNHLEAWIGLPVEVARRMRINQLQLLTIGGVKYEATLQAKINELDPTTRTQMMIFAIDQAANESVVSGQLCEASVHSDVKTKGFWLPTSALSKGVRGLWSVMAVVERDGTFRVQKRDIEIIHTEDNRVFARGTLREGDPIIVDGIHRVAEGQAVAPNETAVPGVQANRP